MDISTMFKRLNHEKLMAARPELIGVVGGWRFYEHPRFGDEVGLVMVKDENAYQSDFYDVPDITEIFDIAVL